MLVIIGLIVGSVLVGQSLISAAAIRAQISQIEKYNTAANTFYGKYGYLPGDIPAAPAAQFGFTARGSLRGQGDGNGIIEGSGSGWAYGGIEFLGETALFWSDLSAANLIEGSFTTASASTVSTGSVVSQAQVALFLPPAKLANNYVAVWSGGVTNNASNSINYFEIEGTTGSSDGIGYVAAYSPSITVSQAYAIDSKLDDGLPMSGRVIAAASENTGASWYGYWVGMQSTPSSISCFDSTSIQYSIQINSGAGVNCAISFRF